MLERNFSPLGISGVVLDETVNEATRPDFRMPRSVEIAADLHQLSVGGVSLALYQAAHWDFKQTDIQAFAAVGDSFFGRWQIHSPHVRLVGKKTGGGVATFDLRVVFTFD
jgi:hypothetical protein